MATETERVEAEEKIIEWCRSDPQMWSALWLYDHGEVTFSQLIDCAMVRIWGRAIARDAA